MASAVHYGKAMTLSLLLLSLALAGPTDYRAVADTTKPKPPAARPAPLRPTPPALKPAPKPPKKPVGEPVLKRRRPPM